MTMVAVASATALLISMLSIAEGVMVNIRNDIKESREDIVIMPGGGIEGGFPQGPEDHIAHVHDICDQLMENSNVEVASPLLFSSLPMNLTDNTTYNMIITVGIIPESGKHLWGKDDVYKLFLFGSSFDIVFDEDEWFDIGADKHFENNYTGQWTHEVVIDSFLAGKYNLKKGDELHFSDFMHIRSYNCTIKGIFNTPYVGGGALDKIVNGFAIIHLSELQDMLAGEAKENDMASQISVSLTEESRSSTQKTEKFASKLKEDYPYYNIITKTDQIRTMEEQTAISRGFYWGIGLVALTISLLFVMCIMIMAVYERTNEIGMMRAIGISTKTIFAEVFVESLLIVILGAFLGLIPGYFGAEYLGIYTSHSLGVSINITAFTPGLIANSLLTIIITGSLASLIPAWKSTRIEITKALKHIG